MCTAKLSTPASLFTLSSGRVAARETFTINVVAEFGGHPFFCAQTYGSVGTTGPTAEVMDNPECAALTAPLGLAYADMTAKPQHPAAMR